MKAALISQVALGALALVSLSAGFAAPSHAGLITQTFGKNDHGTNDGGNDCAGQPNCKASEAGFNESLTGPGSPWIIKFDRVGETSTFAFTVNSALFPSLSLTGAEFSFTDTTPGNGKVMDAVDWTYAPGTGDPSIRFWYAKAGPGGKFFYFDDPSDGLDGLADVVTSGSWSTPDGKDLSHISFYDTAAPPSTGVPEPGTLAVFGLGLLGLGFVARRRRT